MEFLIKNGERIVFIGDSITDCGRRGEFAPLGNGYVKLFNDLVIANFPEIKIKVINKGISGNTILDLQDRWEDDLIYNKPDWVSILIGINDLHRVARKVEFWEEFTPENFRKRYDEILKRTTEKLNCKIILIEPFYISVDKTDYWRGMILRELEDYRKVVKEMSRKYNTYYLKMHQIFQQQLKFREPEVFSSDSVHPNSTGHLVIANALFNLLIKK